MAYKEWRNTLYKAGYAESIVHKKEQRLLASEELEAVGQFSWGSVFSESSRGRISIEMAMSKVSLSHRICMELVPKNYLHSVFTIRIFGAKTGKPGCSNNKTNRSNESRTKKLKTEQEKMGKRVKVIFNGVEKLLPPPANSATRLMETKAPAQTLLDQD